MTRLPQEWRAVGGGRALSLGAIVWYSFDYYINMQDSGAYTDILYACKKSTPTPTIICQHVVVKEERPLPSERSLPLSSLSFCLSLPPLRFHVYL